MNKINLKIIILLLSLILYGCTPSKPNVGILIYDESDTFINEMQDKIITEIGNKYETNVKYAEKNQLLQNEQIIKMINSKISIMIVNPVDRLACGAIAEKNSQKNIPTIFINREPLASDIVGKPNTFYIGAAAESLGEKQALMADQLFGGNFAESKYDKNEDGIIQIVILKGEQGHQDAEKRTQKCIEVMQDLGYKIDILEIKNANWQREEGYAVMSEVYQKFGKSIELIFSNNDDMALGATDYLKNINEKLNDFVIIGVDGTKNGIQAVEDGLIYGTVLNDAEAQSDAVVNLIDYIFNKKSLSDFPYQITNGQFIYIDGKSITKS